MSNKSGYIYILYYPYDPKEPIKVGRSIDADNRTDQLNKNKKTGSLDKGDYIIAYDEYVTDCVEIESIFLKKLDNCRLNKNRELVYNISIREAIKILRQIIDLNSSKPKLDLEIAQEKEEIKNWKNLSFNWQQLLKTHIDLRENLSEKEIIESARNIIDYSKDNYERKLILDLYKDLNYKSKIKEWYNSLQQFKKKIIQTYTGNLLTEKEFIQLFELKVINCCEKTFVDTIKPITFLKQIEQLDISKTNISDLQSIEHLTNLQVLNIEQTKITDIEPLTHLQKLVLLKCYGTNLKPNEIKLFKRTNPICIVDNENPLTK